MKQVCPKISCRYQVGIIINSQIDPSVKVCEKVEFTQIFFSEIESYGLKVPALLLEHAFHSHEVLWLIKEKISLQNNVSFGVRTKDGDLLALRFIPRKEKISLGIGQGRSRSPFGLYENLNIFFRT